MVRRKGFLPVGLVAAAIALAACSSSPASSSPHDGAPADTPPDGAGATSSTIVVGPSGGTVSAGGASVDVPAGALSAPASITVAVADDAPPLPGNVTLAGSIFAFKPHGQAFSSPVTIRVPVTAPGTGTQLYGASADDEVWAPIADAILTNGVLSTQVRHFSWFGPMFLSKSACSASSEPCGNGVICCEIPGYEVSCDVDTKRCKVSLGGPCVRDDDCTLDRQYYGCVGFRCCGKVGASACGTDDASACCSLMCNTMFCL